MGLEGERMSIRTFRAHHTSDCSYQQVGFCPALGSIVLGVQCRDGHSTDGPPPPGYREAWEMLEPRRATAIAKALLKAVAADKAYYKKQMDRRAEAARLKRKAKRKP